MISIPKHISHSHSNSKCNTNIQKNLTTKFPDNWRKIPNLIGSRCTWWRRVFGPVNHWVLKRKEIKYQYFSKDWGWWIGWNIAIIGCTTKQIMQLLRVIRDQSIGGKRDKGNIYRFVHTTEPWDGTTKDCESGHGWFNSTTRLHPVQKGKMSGLKMWLVMLLLVNYSARNIYIIYP